MTENKSPYADFKGPDDELAAVITRHSMRASAQNILNHRNTSDPDQVRWAEEVFRKERGEENDMSSSENHHDRERFAIAPLYSGEATKAAILEGLEAVNQHAEMAQTLTKPMEPDLWECSPADSYLEEVQFHARLALDHATAVVNAARRTSDADWKREEPGE